MNAKVEKRPGKKSWISVLAIILVVVGAVAIAVPLVWQKINYGIAAQKAAEAESQMTIPAKEDYKAVDYSTMKQGVTPSYSSDEMEDAANPPGLLEELGIVGAPSSLLPIIVSAKAESTEPASMKEALSSSAQTLDEYLKTPYDGEAVVKTLALVRKQIENAFFLLTQIQPIANTETLTALSGQKTVDALTRGDKTITAAREMIYNTLTDLEEMLKQVEDQTAAGAAGDGADDAAKTCLTAQLETLSSYLAMAALHLPGDDYQAAISQQEKLVAASKSTAAGNNDSGYDAVDVDPPEVKRTYLLEIPDIGLKVAVIRSGSFNKMYQNMRSGAAMFPRAPEPDTVGNICISAHRTGTRDYFGKLDKLAEGDMIYLHTSHLGSFQYEVVNVSIISNTDWSVTGSVDYPALTLLSCQAFGGISNAQRIAVRAKLVGVANGK